VTGESEHSALSIGPLGWDRGEKGGEGKKMKEGERNVREREWGKNTERALIEDASIA
jgi:hypothetical protein